MYKILYLLTGNVFELPENIAKELKNKYPDEYKIIEKNGKKFNDKIKKIPDKDLNNSIYSSVVEK
ncbi:MAG: hypothetical protein MJ237_07465 [bacterium]|nr:hypothetical protein [bacterium]